MIKNSLGRKKKPCHLSANLYFISLLSDTNFLRLEDFMITSNGM